MAFILTQDGYLQILANNFDTIFVNETENANMTTGITINQGVADDEALALKSEGDVAHALAAIAETDTFLFIKKIVGSTGGVLLTALQENVAVVSTLRFEVYGGQPETSKGTSNYGLLDFYISQHDGAGSVSNITADGNIVSFRCRRGGGETTVFILDEDGDTWQDGIATMDSIILGVTALSEADLTDLTDAGETALHTHAASAGADTTAIHDNVGSEISAITEKVAPIGADMLVLEDSEASNAKKMVQITNLPGGADADAIHDNVDGEINAIADKAAPVDADVIVIEDSEASYAKKKVTMANLPGGGGGVDTSGVPVALDYARFTDLDTIEGREYSEVRTDLGLVIGTNVLAEQAIGIADNNLVEMDDADAAALDYCRLTANGIEGREYSEVRTDLGLVIGTNVLAEQTIGIADNNLVEMDDADAANLDYCRLTTSGIEGREYSEVRTDLGLVIGTNVLAEQTIGIANDNLVEMDDADAATLDYAKFTANGLEGRSYAEVLSDIAGMGVAGGTFTGAVTPADHGTATNPEIVAVVYGTGTAPVASTTPIGSLWVKYTA